MDRESGMTMCLNYRFMFLKSNITSDEYTEPLTMYWWYCISKFINLKSELDVSYIYLPMSTPLVLCLYTMDVCQGRGSPRCVAHITSLLKT